MPPPRISPKKEFVYKELPPTWDGKDPETKFRDWMGELDHWERLTSYPEISRGIMVYRSLPQSVKNQMKHQV